MVCIDGAIPALTLIIGGNQIKASYLVVGLVYNLLHLVVLGLRGSWIQQSLVVGILLVRYVALHLIGILVVKGALKFGLFSLPPAMSIGTLALLLFSNKSSCSLAHSLTLFRNKCKFILKYCLLIFKIWQEQ
ncbi:hypothetical protein DVH24_015790 [Malus domestica]|uniref:Uncharacterized protein n=1 Tax=Malus domestica TaxID=3750 RepID=A0A498HI25_MALDO|nr:hypothetical protein DVH24_015790 [Malus domestica]